MSINQLFSMISDMVSAVRCSGFGVFIGNISLLFSSNMLACDIVRVWQGR